MLDRPLDTEDGRVDRWWVSPLPWLAGAWVTGLLIGRELDARWVWLGCGAALLVSAVLLFHLQRIRWAQALFLLAAVATAASWWSLRVGAGAVWGLEAQPVSRLVSVEGAVEGPIYFRTRSKGLMGQFDYRSPSVTFVLLADRVATTGGAWRSMRGRLIVAVPQFDDRLRIGDRVRCTGWLWAPDSPANPGERDRRQWMRDRGMIGRLALRTRGNCEIIGPVEENRGLLGDIRAAISSRAMRALRHGFDTRSDIQQLDLLEVLLLGEWRGELEQTRSAFRRSGLTHVLAISGLHLGILMIGAWRGLLTVTGRPRAAAVGSIAVVLPYLFTVPPGVAILRSGLMALVACGARALGRGVSPMAAMCGAGLGLLVWRPDDLFRPGFQLSFTVVAALLVATGPVTRWMAPMPLIGPPSPGRRLWRWVAKLLAVSLIAWSASAPLIAYHFGMVVPAGLLTAIVSLPVVALLLWVGYAKILITLLSPELGATLARPLGALSDTISGQATWAAGWPLAMVETPRPAALWVAASLAALALVLRGGLRGRRWPGAVAVAACALWPITPTAGQALLARFSAPPLRLDMLAVGHGSCYLVRSGGRAIVFDCGSSDYLDITTVCVGPALRELGVRRVETLFLSHADMDHVSGSLELVDGFGVRRVALTRAFMEEAARDSRTAAAYLLEQLAARNVELIEVAAGWRQDLGPAELRVVWPPAGATFARSNDASIVLAIEAAGRRILLTGDVQDQAMTMMLSDPGMHAALAADVLELPHHGSMETASRGFLAAVGPTIVLQSAGGADVRRDAWTGHLGQATRHITAIHGAVQITVTADGSIEQRRFRSSLETAPASEPYNQAWLNVEVNP